MKKSSTMFLQAVVGFIGVGTLALMLWEPHLEGRNVDATIFEIYFRDPFLAYAYTASMAFFVALYQAFELLGFIGMLAKRKMSVTEPAEKVGVTMANISVLKNGKARAIRLSTLEAVCRALECQPGDIEDLKEVAAKKWWPAAKRQAVGLACERYDLIGPGAPPTTSSAWPCCAGRGAASVWVSSPSPAAPARRVAGQCQARLSGHAMFRAERFATPRIVTTPVLELVETDRFWRL